MTGISELREMFLQLNFKRLVETAKIPKYATEGSAGMDLSAAECVEIKPGERKLVSTGLAVKIPSGYEMQIRPRSGLAFKNGVTVLNSPGTIDSDYRGTIGVILINHGTESFFVNNGDRIAQAVIAEVKQFPCIEVESLDDTIRGSGGFGSSGIK